jgi:PAS domain S-box-containing protein
MTSSLERVVLETSAKDAAWPLLPVVLADLDTGEILYASTPLATVFGYGDAAELTGKPIETLVPEPLRSQHVVWRKDVFTPQARFAGQGRKVTGRRKDGGEFPVQILLTSIAVPGRRVGVAIVADLTGILLSDAVSRAAAEGAEGLL